MRHAAAGVDVLDLQAAEFFAAQAVVEQGGEESAVAKAFEETSHGTAPALAPKNIYVIAFTHCENARSCLVGGVAGYMSARNGVQRYAEVAKRDRRLKEDFVITLYDYLPSQNAWKVRQLLGHLGIPYP